MPEPTSKHAAHGSKVPTPQRPAWIASCHIVAIDRCKELLLRRMGSPRPCRARHARSTRSRCCRACNRTRPPFVTHVPCLLDFFISGHTNVLLCQRPAKAELVRTESCRLCAPTGRSECEIDATAAGPGEACPPASWSAALAGMLTSRLLRARLGRQSRHRPQDGRHAQHHPDPEPPVARAVFTTRCPTHSLPQAVPSLCQYPPLQADGPQARQYAGRSRTTRNYTFSPTGEREIHDGPPPPHPMNRGRRDLLDHKIHFGALSRRVAAGRAPNIKGHAPLSSHRC